MPFLSITFQNFRNLENKSIDINSKEVFFVGQNGQGKSNILEALYMASYGSSFRTHRENEIIKNGTDSYIVSAFYKAGDDLAFRVSINLKDGKKLIERNGKRIRDRKELINKIPSVVFCHDDMDFVIGEPERKRYFLDQTISMYDSLYLDDLMRYKKILKSRNMILKEKKFDMINIYDPVLIESGIELQKKRALTIFRFNNIFTKIYNEVSGIDNVKVQYYPSWKSDSPKEIMQFLMEKRELEKLNGTTLSGPHRDRIMFVKDGENFVTKASTGQRRLIALVLRIVQCKYYSEQTGKKPVLLLDDVLLELDPEKRQKLTALLPEYDQLFCTFLPEEPYERYKHSTTKVIKIENGAWS